MASDPVRRVAITGASGLVGAALVRSLRQDGLTVQRLVRREARGPDEVFWDPATGRIDAARLEGVDAVVHLAGESLAGGLWTEEYKTKIRESRVRGTGLVAGALAGLTRPSRVLISASAVGIYGDRGEATLTEADPPGSGFLAEVAQAWEAAAEPARQAGIRVVHPRFGVIVDPAGGMLRTALLPFQLGLGARLGSGRQWMSWITLRDVIAVIRLFLERNDLAGPINVTAPVPVTNRQFTASLAEAVQRPAFLFLPAPLLKLFLGDLGREAMLASTRAVPGRLLEAGYPFRDSDLKRALVELLGNRESRAVH